MTEKKSAAQEPVRRIDPQLVETLGEIATRLDLSEIEVVQGDLKIRVARQLGAAAVQVATVAAPAQVPLARTEAPTQTSAVMHPGTITSPMVGTAYLRPAPDAACFIETGAQVKAGEKLLLIEAMKTFNEIVAPRAGTVTAILVEDGQPVEFGQPLVVVE
jgi:acetyl-CoA carboxylase biotin carboxyl carrier protein